MNIRIFKIEDFMFQKINWGFYGFYTICQIRPTEERNRGYGGGMLKQQWREHQNAAQTRCDGEIPFRQLMMHMTLFYQTVSYFDKNSHNSHLETILIPPPNTPNTLPLGHSKGHNSGTAGVATVNGATCKSLHA
jgi:hypothetical protein